MSRTDSFPSLDAAPVTHSLEVPAAPGAPIDDLSIPAAPGVVIFEAADGTTVLIATTADTRALVRKRLGLIAPEAEASPARSWRVDYRVLTRRVLVIRVGSSLEADAVYLAQARARLPQAHKVVSERWRAWFVHVDPDAEFPEWTKTNLFGLVGTRSASTLKSAEPNSGVLIGPLQNKDAAGRFIEAVVDAFDLCRFHHLLVQAPRASACAYKEMGRCPAPCDGTESMEDYRRRTRESIDTLSAGALEAGTARLDGLMREAAESHDFERAQRLKKQAERLAALGKPAFVHVGRLDRWQRVLILPSPAKKHVRCVLFAGGRLLVLGDAEAAKAEDLKKLVEAAAACIPPQMPVVDDTAIDTIALLTRWLFTAAKKRRGEILGLDAPHEMVCRAARSVARLEDTPAVIEDQHVEAA